jgi:hypothetical protein
MGPPDLDAKKAAAQIKNLQEKVARLSKLVEEDKSTYKVDAPDLFALGSIDIKRLEVLNSTLRKLAAAGMPFAKGGNINDVLNKVGETFDRMTGNAEMGAKAVEALTKNFKQFAVIADMPGGAKMAEDFSNQAAALDRLGLGFGEYTKNMDLAMNMFNLTSDKVKSLNQGLSDFAKEMKMMPSVVSQNFQLVAKSLSYEAPKVAEQFQKMQRLSQQTGVSIGTFMGGMGDKLDTIGGAAQFTGQLNAIMGRNVFSPNQILMMDEAERMVKIREVLQGSPIYNEIASGGKLGKFALNTISKLTGFSKEDTRKYILGQEGDGSLKTLMADKAPGGRITGGETKSGDKLAAGNQFFGQGAAQKLNENLVNMTNQIKNLYLGAQDRAFVEDRAKLMAGGGGGPIKATMMRSLMDKSLVDFGQGDEIQRTSGEGKEVFAAARFRFPQISELFRKLQTMPETLDDDNAKDFRKKFTKLVGEAGDEKGLTPAKMKSIQSGLNELLKASTTVGVPTSEGYDDVDEIEQEVLKRMTTVGGMRRRALRFFRENDTFDLNNKKEIDNMTEEARAQYFNQRAEDLDTRLRGGMSAPSPAAVNASKRRAEANDQSVPAPDTSTVLPSPDTDDPFKDTGASLSPGRQQEIMAMMMGAVKGMQFVINLGPGQPNMIVNAGLEELS